MILGIIPGLAGIRCTGPQESESNRMTQDNPLDICGLCGRDGADKMAAWTGGGVYWPGETKPETELVHASCEAEEQRRAHAALSPDQIENFLNGVQAHGP